MSNRKVALVTGATGGIGSATAIALARTGEYNLALHYHSAGVPKRDELRRAIREQSPTPLEIEFFQADMGDLDAVRQLHHDATATLGGIDVLFGNAGSDAGASGVQRLGDISLEAFETAWRVNVASNVLLAQLCLPHMEARVYGRIILTSSLAALTGGAVGPHYASSKSALHGFIHWLGGSVAEKGITVNGIAPGLIEDTAILPAAASASKIPVGRFGKPTEIADTVLWMVNTGYLTRKIITLDGGLFSR